MARVAEGLRYHIFDPTGNITALVEGEVEVARQPAVAARIMRRHPDVEQVGFVGSPKPGSPVRARIRMAGGEFCGNASMSAAAWFALREGAEGNGMPAGGAWLSVPLAVSGASQPVEVRLRSMGERAFEASVRMPQACSIDKVRLSFGPIVETVPVVRMEGISHAVIGPDSAFFALRKAAAQAEAAVRKWCARLGCDGLGLMFVESAAGERQLTPLVYVPGGDTVFWESSCASGSAAVGMHAAAHADAPVSLGFRAPGGRLRVESDPTRGETWLAGTVRLAGSYMLS